MERSRFAPVYLALFLASIAGIVWLNLPRLELPPQDISRLFTDPWVLFALAYFSFLLMPAAMLMGADSYRRETRWGVLTPIYLALGIVPLALYLAMRPETGNGAEPSWLRKALKRRWFWWACLAGLALSVILLPLGSAAGFLDAMRHNFGWWFMIADIALNQIFVLPLVTADMAQRNVTNQYTWIPLILLTGPVGLCLYMARNDGD